MSDEHPIECTCLQCDREWREDISALVRQPASPAPAGEVGRELRELVEQHWSRFSAEEVRMLRRAADTIAALEAEKGRLLKALEEAAQIAEEAAKIADLSAYYNGGDDSRREVAETIAREIRAASQQGEGD